MAFDVVTYALLKKSTSNEINKILESLAEGMKFKGEVATWADLPENPKNGDLYIISQENKKAVYDGTKWIVFDANPTKISELENDENYIKADELTKYRTSEEQDLIDATKQAKLIPGNNVHISDTNEISVDECKIGKSFTTNKSVGNLPINTEISADMTIAEILYKILYGGEVSTINLYYGASDTIPTDLTGLNIIENQSVDVLLADGKLQKIITGHVDASGNHVNQYPVFACDKSAKLIGLKKWSTEDFDVDIPFKTVESDTFNVYYLEDPTYDQDLGGTVYKFKFMEVLNGN